MLSRWPEFNRPFPPFDELRRRMFDLSGSEPEARLPGVAFGTEWPRVNVVDLGDHLEVSAEVPGLAEKDVQLSVHNDLLTLRGERPVTVPEGATLHRSERVSLRFSRAVSLPCKVDSERTAATLKNGVLTITLPKAADARPRTIAVKAQ